MGDPSDRLFIAISTDEDVSTRLADILRERGFDVESVITSGTVRLSDEEQLAQATARGRAILTYNQRDFLLLARQWHDAGREHAGIILSRQFSNRETGELLRQVCNLLDAVSAEEMWNTVRNLQSYR